MDKPARLSEEQVEVLNNLVREKRESFLPHDIDIRLWGPVDDASHYRIVYHGNGDVTDELAGPFMLYGPGTVVFEAGEVSSLPYEVT